ncbi:MAG: hypothetical protein GY765_26355 [bacterium]|nr:hypothetical protein [bacterium]
MTRHRRHWVSGERGSFHIVSRTSGGNLILEDDEKEYFVNLMERLAEAYFVTIHAFAVMGTHFHCHATGHEMDAENADGEELLRRYRLIYGEDAEPPIGSYEISGFVLADEDGGTERLRRRLGSISRFVQELKQTFSRWYNKIHSRTGTMWSERFKGIIVEKGNAQLICSAYIDLNAVRAGLVERPEDYRWCSIGLKTRNPKRAKKMLGPVFESTSDQQVDTDGLVYNDARGQFSWYREFVYISGGIPVVGKAKIAAKLVEDVKMCHGKLGICDSLSFRIRNISEGIAIGSFSFISAIQKKCNRKFIRPRPLLIGHRLFTTRVLRGS